MVDENQKYQPCMERHRLDHIENAHETLRDDIKEIRDGFTGLTKELHSIGGDLRGFAVMAQSMLSKLEDRDKAQAETTADIKDTFKRFGSKMDSLEDRLRQLEVSTPRLDNVERVIKYVVLGLGGLVVFYIQQRIT